MYYFLQKDLDLLDEEIYKILGKIKKLGQELGESCRQSSETWHDNFPYESAKQQAAVLEIQLKDLIAIRRNSEIIEKEINSKKVGIGNIIKILNIETNKEELIVIGSYLPLDGKSVSYNSPLGQLLLEAEIGDTKIGKIGGKEKSFKILMIS